MYMCSILHVLYLEYSYDMLHSDTTQTKCTHWVILVFNVRELYYFFFTLLPVINVKVYREFICIGQGKITNVVFN